MTEKAGPRRRRLVCGHFHRVQQRIEQVERNHDADRGQWIGPLQLPRHGAGMRLDLRRALLRVTRYAST